MHSTAYGHDVVWLLHYRKAAYWWLWPWTPPRVKPAKSKSHCKKKKTKPNTKTGIITVGGKRTSENGMFIFPSHTHTHTHTHKLKLTYIFAYLFRSADWVSCFTVTHTRYYNVYTESRQSLSILCIIIIIVSVYMYMWEGLAYIGMTYNNLIVFFKQQQVIL